MAKIELLPLVSVVCALGFLSHIGYFIRGEHHLQAYRFLLAAMSAPAIMFLILYRFNDSTLVQAVLYASAVWWAYFLALWTSMITYRILFHPLKAYPGPLLWKISKLLGWLPAINNLDNYKVIDRLHQQYGDYVRVGPKELSIIDPAAVDAIYGPRSKCSKSAQYDTNHPLVSLQTMRERHLHDRRRRTAWDAGFSMRSLRDYESRIMKYSDELVSQISAFGGKPVNATAWMMYFGFDVMGSLVFAKSFDMLKRGGNHWAIEILHQCTRPWGFIRHCPWLLNMLKPIPLITDRLKRFENFSEESYENRLKSKPEEKDIMSHIIGAEPLFPQDPQKQRYLEIGDSRLVIIAGSDTTSSTLTYALYHLAKVPAHVAAIREELKNGNVDKDFKILQLQDLKYLNGFIMEVLRLNPALPSGVNRETPPEGLHIGDHFIPGHTDVMVPVWALHRSPKAYINPHAFLPERWSSRPDLIAYSPTPFVTFGGTNTYSCIGKNLALMELRTVITKLVQRFDIVFAPGENGHRLIDGSLDTFVIDLKDFWVDFRERK